MNELQPEIGKDCIARIIAGDTRAYEQVYSRWFSPLCNYARRFFPDEAEEIVQDCLLRVWESREKLANITSLRAYLYQMVHNACLNHHKHQKVVKKYRSEAAYLLRSIELEQSSEQLLEQISHDVNQAIDQLSEQCQRVFKMKYKDGLKYKQIAEQLSISERTVETHVVNALRQLREFFKSYSFTIMGLLFFSQLLLHGTTGFAI